MKLPTDTRLPTQRELAQWNKTVQRIGVLDNRVAGLGLLVDNLQTATRFSNRMGFNRLYITPAFEKRYQNAAENVSKLKKVVEEVEAGNMSLLPKNGDIDIVGSIVENPLEHYQKYNVQLDGLPIIFAGAAKLIFIVVSALVVTVAAIWKSVESMWSEANTKMREAEKHFCKEPGSPACKQWLQKEKKTVGENRKLAVDLFGGGFGGGLGVGAMIAIGVGLYLLSRGKK